MNYPGIAFLMFLENVFPPIPSELVMPLAGFTAGRGDLSMWGVILAGLVGSLVGQLPLYYLGKIVGEEKLSQWADKYGAWLTISSDEIHKSVEWFDKHGGKAVIFARMVPGIRSLISLPAGIGKMPLGKFLLYSALGMGTWTTALAFAGYLLKDQYKIVEKYIGPVAYVVLGGTALYIIYNVVKRKREGKDTNKDDGADSKSGEEADREAAQA